MFCFRVLSTLPPPLLCTCRRPLTSPASALPTVAGRPTWHPSPARLHDARQQQRSTRCHLTLAAMPTGQLQCCSLWIYKQTAHTVVSPKSVHTQSTVSLHSVYTQSTLSPQSAHSQSTLSLHSVHSQHIVSLHSVYSLTVVSLHSIDTRSAARPQSVHAVTVSLANSWSL